MKKPSVEKAVIREGQTLREALASLDRSSLQVVLVADQQERVVGVLTDGDLRRAMLRGASLQDPVDPITRRTFAWVPSRAARADVLDLMHAQRISAVPILDERGRAIGLHLMHDMLAPRRRENWAVIMAGGRGSRLAPLTDTIPKPMLRVAGRPILERILLQLVGAGIQRVFLSVNYLAHVIEEHFGRGERFGCRIDYLRENEPLGTAGAISLLPEPPRDPLLVMNGDLMTQASLGDVLDFHDQGGQIGTIVVRRYLHSVPFGCVELDEARVVGFEEKPALERMVNAGIYALAPELVQRIPRGKPSTMPELLAQAVAVGEHVAAWEIDDDWIDVGQRDQLDKARGHG